MVELIELIEKLGQYVAMIKKAKQENPEMEEPANLEEAENCILEATRGRWFFELQWVLDFVEKKPISEYQKLINKGQYVNFKENLAHLIETLEERYKETRSVMLRKPKMKEPANFEKAERYILQWYIYSVKNELNWYRQQQLVDEGEGVNTELLLAIKKLKQYVEETKQAMRVNPKIGKSENLKEVESFVVEATNSVWYLLLQRSINRLNKLLKLVEKGEGVNTELLLAISKEIGRNFEEALKEMQPSFFLDL